MGWPRSRSAELSDPGKFFVETAAESVHVQRFGVDVDGAATNFFEHTAEIARAMVANSASVILIADHSKIGVTSRVRFCELDRVSAIVTDRKAKRLPALDALSNVVGRVIVADA